MARPLRVLVVEDIPDDAELMALALGEDGLAPVWERVETAAALSAALAAGPWDVVLSDYTLPEFDAAAALAIVRAADPDLPFVVVSGTVGEELAASLMRDGANDYILKFNLVRLAPAVHRELRVAAARRERRAADRLGQDVLDSLSAHVAVLDPKGVIIRMNQAWERYFTANGPVRREQYGVGANYLEVCEKASGPRSAEAGPAAAGILRVLRGESPSFTMEYPCHSPTEQKWFVLHATPLRPAGQGAVVSHTDISDRKRAAEALRRQDEKLAEAVRVARLGYWNREIATGIVDWSEMLYEIFGLAPDGFGRTYEAFLALVYPDDRAAVAGRVGAAEAALGAFDHTYRTLVRGDLRVIHEVGRVTAGKDGKPARVSGTAQDVTDRARADEVLAASERRYRRLFETARDGILIVDAVSRRVLDVNPYLTELLGYHRDALVGQEVQALDLFRGADDPAAVFGKLSQVGDIHANDYPVLTPDGRRIVVEVVSTRYAVGDAEVIQCNVRDLTERATAQEAVRASEARYRTLVAATAAIVWDSPPSGAFDTEQPGWTAFTGQSIEQHRGWGWLDAIHPDDREASNQAWAVAVAGNGPYLIEHRVRRADAEYRHMSARAVPVLNPGGAIREWVGVHTDVTEQRRAEIERADLLARLNLQIERMPLAYLLSDADFRYTRWNPAAERMFGFAAAEVVGKHPFEVIVPPASRPLVGDIFARLAAGDMNAHGTSENCTKDGRVIACEWYNTPLLGPDGTFLGLLSLAQDVTDRRQAQEALRSSELRLKHVLASSPAVLFTVAVVDGRFRRITWVSDNLTAMLGYRPEEAFPPEWWTDNIEPDARDRVLAQNHEQLFGRGYSTHEYRFRHKDGGYRWLRAELRTVRDAAGRPVEAVGSWADVSDRKELEDQFRHVQKMEAVGQLAGGIAHDFNNLLTIINGYSDLLLQTLSPDDPSRDALTDIHAAGERSAGLTHQLLAFSRRQVMAPQVLDLNQVVADTEKMLRRLIGEDVTLAADPAPGLWAIHADPGQIEQVLMNLAVNARDAMPGGGRLTITTRNVDLDAAFARTHPDTAAGPHVHLTVSDTGVGMDPEVLARSFEPFFTTKGLSQGTGLGLATVYGIVRQSGGIVTVRSEVGAGTTFDVYLPRADEPEPGPPAAPAAAPLPSGAETILLVEDEAAVRVLTRHVLAGCGYTVLEAANGSEAALVAAAHGGRIDLLLTDVVMPGVSGQAVAEYTARTHPGVRVLFMSGYMDDAVVRHGVLRDGVNFLQKPFTPSALTIKVRAVLDAPDSPSLEGHA